MTVVMILDICSLSPVEYCKSAWRVGQCKSHLDYYSLSMYNLSILMCCPGIASRPGIKRQSHIIRESSRGFVLVQIIEVRLCNLSLISLLCLQIELYAHVSEMLAIIVVTCAISQTANGCKAYLCRNKPLYLCKDIYDCNYLWVFARHIRAHIFAIDDIYDIVGYHHRDLGRVQWKFNHLPKFAWNAQPYYSAI